MKRIFAYFSFSLLLSIFLPSITYGSLDSQDNCRGKCLEKNKDCMRLATSLSKETVSQAWLKNNLPQQALSQFKDLDKSNDTQSNNWVAESKGEKLIFIPKNPSLKTFESSLKEQIEHCNKITSECLKKCEKEFPRK